MELQDVTIRVRIDGVDEATAKAIQLVATINKAKTLAGELALLIEGLEVKVDV